MWVVTCHPLMINRSASRVLMEDRHRNFRALVRDGSSAYRPPGSDLYPAHFEPDGVTWPVPTTPGLDVEEVNEEMLDVSYELTTARPTRRRDGSLAT